MKETRTENVILESYAGIELLVTYDYEESSQVEDFHGMQELTYSSATITYVELVIGGDSIAIDTKCNLLPYLTKSQIKSLESQLEVYN